VVNADECLSECQTFEGLDFDGDGNPDIFCNWFAYDPETQRCDFLSSCDYLTDSCSSCVSGSVYCKPENVIEKGKLYRKENSVVILILSILLKL